MHIRNNTFMLVAALASASAFAQDAGSAPTPPTEAAAAAPAVPVEKPSPEAITSFWTYYFKGQGSGPAVGEAKLCLEVAKDGPNKFECSKEVPPEGVKVGTNVLVWGAYLLPQGDSVENMSLQVKLGDTIRETKDFKLKGESFRTRNWNSVRISKKGTWNIVLKHGENELKTLTVTAN
jgi:hypothetical protein